MFNNLIESSSHAREFKRRGSFVLFTAATYVLVFVVAGVMSIYAYDARVDSKAEITMLSPMVFCATSGSYSQFSTSATNRPTEVVRQVAMASVNRPDVSQLQLQSSQHQSAVPALGGTESVIVIPARLNLQGSDAAETPGMTAGMAAPSMSTLELRHPLRLLL